MPPVFADPNEQSLPLWLVSHRDGAAALPDGLEPGHRQWAQASGFTAAVGQTCLLPDGACGLAGALFGLGAGDKRPARERFGLARALDALPGGVWHLAAMPEGYDRDEAALGWLFGQYRFDRYKAASKRPLPSLRAPEGCDAARLLAIAEAEFLTRDLINTPANDMGPAALERAACNLAERFGAEIRVTTGEDLLTGNLPLIHAVGRAGAEAPRLIDMRIGDRGPRLTLVGKGVCFDTGGLDIKPASSMALMKKDMGGAANVIGLASMIMARGLDVDLRLLVPAVENAIAGNAFRPGDILQSRKGITVEVGNTDAEGRLVLADALTLAAEDDPDLIIDMATLTGAARVALGPDLPPFYTGDDALAAALEACAARTADPVWRMPLYQPYAGGLKSSVADTNNVTKDGFAGSITAALFLAKFVGDTARWMHFDIYGWNPAKKPHAPVGGEAQAIRALDACLAERYG